MKKIGTKIYYCLLTGNVIKIIGDMQGYVKETTFDEDLGADSLDLFDLVMKFEDEFEVKIPTEELENIKTVGDVCDYIEKNK